MPWIDLSGKSVFALDRDQFDKLFCRQCHEYQECDRNEGKILGCKAFVDTGLWDAFYRKRRGD